MLGEHIHSLILRRLLLFLNCVDFEELRQEHFLVMNALTVEVQTQGLKDVLDLVVGEQLVVPEV